MGMNINWDGNWPDEGIPDSLALSLAVIITVFGSAVVYTLYPVLFVDVLSYLLERATAIGVASLSMFVIGLLAEAIKILATKLFPANERADLTDVPWDES